MAYQDIRKDFVDGVQEIFTTLFNNGSETSDGVYLYLLSSQRSTNVYGERKYKSYQEPKLLVCQAKLNPMYGEQTMEEIKDQAEFVVPLKSLQENGLEVTHEALEEMRKGVLKFHDTVYIIDNIIPKAYVEDVFLMYRFICTEDVNKTSVVQFYQQEYEETSEVTGEDESVDSVEEAVSYEESISVSEAVSESVADNYEDEQEVESNNNTIDMRTNTEESTLNSNPFQIPSSVDVITENGVKSTSYPV